MAVQAEGPALQCPASPLPQIEIRSCFTAAVRAGLQGQGRLGWHAPFSGSLWCVAPAPCPAVLSSLLLVSAWEWQGGLPAPGACLWGWELPRGSSPQGALDDLWQLVSDGWNR